MGQGFGDESQENVYIVRKCLDCCNVIYEK